MHKECPKRDFPRIANIDREETVTDAARMFKQMLTAISNELKDDDAPFLIVKKKEVDLKRFNEFAENHMHPEIKEMLPINDRFSFIVTPLGYVTIVIVRCNRCGKECNITNRNLQ